MSVSQIPLPPRLLSAIAVAPRPPRPCRCDATAPAASFPTWVPCPWLGFPLLTLPALDLGALLFGQSTWSLMALSPIRLRLYEGRS